MPDPFTEIDLPFPLAGLDVHTSLAYQPGGTAAEGVNVRVVDPDARRSRGGSRPGLSKWIPQQIPEGAELIQHLNVIVDPPIDGEGLPGYYPDPDTGIIGGAEPGNAGEPDPSTNTAYYDNGGTDPVDPTDPLTRNPYRVVRYGGSGVQPHRHRPGGFFHPAAKNLYVATVVSGSGASYTVSLDSGTTATATLLNGTVSTELSPGVVVMAVKIDTAYYFQAPLWEG